MTRNLEGSIDEHLAAERALLTETLHLAWSNDIDVNKVLGAQQSASVNFPLSKLVVD